MGLFSLTGFTTFHVCAGSQADDLHVRKGDIVDVLEKHNDFWLSKNIEGKTGWVPSSYLEQARRTFSFFQTNIVDAKIS